VAWRQGIESASFDATHWAYISARWVNVKCQVPHKALCCGACRSDCETCGLAAGVRCCVGNQWKRRTFDSAERPTKRPTLGARHAACVGHWAAGNAGLTMAAWCRRGGRWRKRRCSCGPLYGRSTAQERKCRVPFVLPQPVRFAVVLGCRELTQRDRSPAAELESTWIGTRSRRVSSGGSDRTRSRDILREWGRLTVGVSDCCRDGSAGRFGQARRGRVRLRLGQHRVLRQCKISRPRAVLRRGAECVLYRFQAPSWSWSACGWSSGRRAIRARRACLSSVT